jgi:homocitrate synthase NifV
MFEAQMEQNILTPNEPVKVWMIDTTLRDGEQAPGVSFDRKAKLSIAQALDQAGIDELEVGTPVMGGHVQEDIRRIAALGLHCRLSVWCRAHPADLEAAARCNVSGVHFSLPVSNIHLNALGKDRSWALNQMEMLVHEALTAFDRITVGAQDASRADEDFLMKFARRVHASGAHRLRIADTVGIGRPSTISRLIRCLRLAVPDLDLEFHGHNDLGMATANALCALESGARSISVTVNGLGERAGNTALEQIVMALGMHPDLSSAMDAAAMLPLSRLVARAADRVIAPDQPVVGDRVFTHESGIHCHAMFNDARSYEPFAPQQAGHSDRRFVLGSHSGGSAICNLLRQAGIRISARQAQSLRPLLAAGGPLEISSCQ